MLAGRVHLTSAVRDEGHRAGKLRASTYQVYIMRPLMTHRRTAISPLWLFTYNI